MELFQKNLTLLIVPKTIDLCFVESKELDTCPCITARYDAGICKHKAERGGVLYADTN